MYMYTGQRAYRATNVLIHLGGTCACIMSSGNSIWSPLGQKKMSLLVRCPDFWGHEQGVRDSKMFEVSSFQCALNICTCTCM